MKMISRIGAALFVLLLTKGPLLAGMHCNYGSSGGCGKVALLLLSLAAGYGVWVVSQSQTRPLDVLGRIIGGIILVVSFVGLLCIAACAMKCKMDSMCGGKRSCPMSLQQMDSQAAPAPETN